MAGSIYNLEFKSAGICYLQLRQSLVDVCKNLYLTLSIPEIFNLQMTQIFTIVLKNERGNFYIYIVIKYVIHFMSVHHLNNKECMFKIDTVVQSRGKQSPIFFVSYRLLHSSRIWRSNVYLQIEKKEIQKLSLIFDSLFNSCYHHEINVIKMTVLP